MPRWSNALMISSTSSRRRTSSPSSNVPSQSVLSRSHTTHLMTCLSTAILPLVTMFGDKNLLHLSAAFDDLHNLGVTQITLDRRLAAASTRSVDLYGIVRHLRGHG